MIWQTGKLYAEQGKARVTGKANVWVNDFIKEMENAYAAADVVISRAGAMAIAEICLIAKPAVFVPYPHAAEDHQTYNAKTLVDDGAAFMVKDAMVKDDLVRVKESKLGPRPRIAWKDRLKMFFKRGDRRQQREPGNQILG